MEEHIDITKFKYVLYARKSTDDAQRQVRSIDDQIAECRQLAERLGIRIADVVIEKKSAKKPGLRPLFRQMMKDIQKGKYDGIIAWHPDRLARNMKEGGEVIDMIDENYIKDMKFVMHHFSKDANGKMLLGMAFVLSKQYSDNLSQNVLRGVRRNFAEGKSAAHKHGYERDEDGIYRPHPIRFLLMRKAWEMRLAGQSLDTINEFLNEQKYSRPMRERQVSMKPQRLSDVFKDPFYYGILIQANQQVDLRTVYMYFQPMITEQEYTAVQRTADTRSIPFKQKAKRAPYLPLRMLLTCAYCGSRLIPGASQGKTKRYLFYRCDGRYCTRKQQNIKRNIRGKIIFDQILRYIQENLKLDKDDYQAYLKGLHTCSKTRQEKILVEIHSKESLLRDTRLQKRDLAYKLLNERHKTVRTINEEKLSELEENEERYATDIAKLKQQLPEHNQEALSITEFLNSTKNAVKAVQSDDPVIRDTICRKLFLNFSVGDQKILSYQLNQPFATLVKYHHLRFSRGKARELELSGLKNLLEEILQAQKNTAQKEAFTKLYQNVPKHPDYRYKY